MQYHQDQHKTITLSGQAYALIDVDGEIRTASSCNENSICEPVLGENTHSCYNDCGACCGNGIIDTGEQCDGANIPATCASLGYGNGTIACHADCTFDVSKCITETQPVLTTVCTHGDTLECGTDTGECRKGIRTCINGVWGQCENSTGPTSEICDNRDNDCDGQTDENLICDCFIGQSRECGSRIGECMPGISTCINGQWGECIGGRGPTLELCGDGLDNDCNGITDDNCTIPQSAICENGRIPELGCFCGGVFYTSGYCYNSIYTAEKPRGFPWLLLVLIGCMLLCIMFIVLIYNKRDRIKDMTMENLTEVMQ